MNVFVAPESQERGKFRGVVQAFPQAWGGAILDVGCRSTQFQQALAGAARRYVALDLCPPAHIVGNLEAGLPFPDESFDTTVALDVLEHTNDIHRSLYELCRLARKHVVLSLPNAYEFRGRVKFMLGQQISGKYGLPVEPVVDRHRWLFSLSEAERFCQQWAAHCGFRVMRAGCLIGPKRAATLGQRMIGAFPDLLAPTYLVWLTRGTQ